MAERIDGRSARYTDGKYPVAEMFTSIQSEGTRGGTLAHFLRFSGCNRVCSFCDTPMNEFHWMSPAEIVEELGRMEKAFPTGRQLVVTGGEPMVHRLMPLLVELKLPWENGWFIAMESNGDLIESKMFEEPAVFTRIHWLAVSPKAELPKQYLAQASELKYVVPDHEDLVWPDHPRVFVQPEFNNPSAVARCLEIISKNPRLRLSVQTHKYLGLR